MVNEVYVARLRIVRPVGVHAEPVITRPYPVHDRVSQSVVLIVRGPFALLDGVRDPKGMPKLVGGYASPTGVSVMVGRGPWVALERKRTVSRDF